MGARRKPASRRRAFINLPYHSDYESVYLALIAGAAGYGLVPSAAVHDPSSNSQLSRIYDLIASASVSFHDLSWMKLDGDSNLPRLNMAFELGLAVATARMPRVDHQWFVFDTAPHRLHTALSDLGGYRPRVHDFSPESVLLGLMNALARQKHQPTLENLLAIYRKVEKAAARIKSKYSNDLFDTRPFNDLSYVANQAAHKFIPSLAK